MAFKTGDRVHQQTYGAGDIIEVRGQHVTIAFDDSVTRKFIVSMVVLEPCLVPRPPRPASASRARAPRARPAAAARGTAS